jgi:hypothetical protein
MPKSTLCCLGDTSLKNILMRFAEPFMGSDTCFWVRYWWISKKYFFEFWDTFWIDAGWCLAKTASPSWFCKCFEAPYKTAKILSVKGSMNKVSNFVNHLQNETSQNQRALPIKSIIRWEFFIIIVRFIHCCA